MHPESTKYSTASVNSLLLHVQLRIPAYSGAISSHCSSYSDALQCPACQLNPPITNPISTTYPISSLSTQPYANFCRRPVSKELLNAKNSGAGITRRQFPTPGNPLFSALFHYSISLPVTSIRHTQHVILRLFWKHIHRC